MNQQKILVLLCFAFCILHTSQANQKDAYVISYVWPVYASFSDKLYTRQDFPFFDGENFALNYFYPMTSFGGLCTPMFCNKPFSFNATEIKEHDKIYLEKYFVRFDQYNFQTSQDLWRKYGNCFNQTESNYFETMVKAHKKFNIVHALQQKNIYPCEETIYDTQQVVEALSQALNGQKPELYCSNFHKDEKSGEFVSYLRHFEVYLDKNLNPTQTSQLCLYEYCPQKIKIPPFKY
ncbi:hypothetical protein ABPG74_000815 [Tetrahymena malaccensis]